MIAIKNFEMPKDCVDCKLCLLGYCSVIDRRIFQSTRRNDCPLVEIEKPKTGHWVDDEVDSFSKSFGYKKFHCSRCLKVIEGICAKKTDYCPCCGAKMEEVEE